MGIFSKQGSKPDTDTTGAKRDMTIVNEPKKRPDHVRVTVGVFNDDRILRDPFDFEVVKRIEPAANNLDAVFHCVSPKKWCRDQVLVVWHRLAV